MTHHKRFTSFFSLFLVTAVLLSSLAFVPAAFAQSDCGDFYTVKRGDTLREIANLCETTVAALVRANPQIDNPNLIFPGQVLVLPGALLPGSGRFDTYVIQRGDTLRELAVRFDTTVARLLELNPEIKNASVIYEGQRLTVPASTIPDTGTGRVYIVKRGDTLYRIALRFETTVNELLKLNPQITNRNRIFVGQTINLPPEEVTYVVQRGDTLRKIADRFETTVTALLELNPQIKNANLIFPGQVLRVR